MYAIVPCYAQIYVGVHFPFDVIGGAVVGLLLGYVAASVFNRRIGLKLPEEKNLL